MCEALGWSAVPVTVYVLVPSLGPQTGRERPEQVVGRAQSREGGVVSKGALPASPPAGLPGASEERRGREAPGRTVCGWEAGARQWPALQPQDEVPRGRSQVF